MRSILRRLCESVLTKRNSEKEGSPVAFTALDPHIAAMSPDDLTGEIQTDAQARICFFFWIGHLVETLKNLVVMDFGNADAEVLYADNSFLGVCSKTHD